MPKGSGTIVRAIIAAIAIASMDASAVQVSVTDLCGNTLSAGGALTSVDQNGNLAITGATGNYVSLLGCGTQTPTVPACSLSASAATIAPGGSVAVYANCTSTPTSYAWTSPSDTPITPTGPSFTATFSNAGAYTYSVAASNASGQGSSSNQLTILVGDSNTKPICTVSFSPVILVQGNKSRLKAVCNPAPTSYSWTWGGPQPTGAGGELTFTSPGTFSYTVKGTTAQGTGPTASATVTVLGGVTVTHAFSPATVATGGTSTDVITLSNPNSVAATGVGFTDTHPTQIVNSTPVGASSTCGGTVTAADGGSSVALSGGSVPASGSCTIQLAVTGTTGGSTWSDSTGTISTANMGTTAGASATLTVLNPPIASVFFNPTSVATGSSSTLTLKATNPNTPNLTGVGITATYPSGLVNAATPNATSNCGGTISAPAGGTTLSVTGLNVSQNGPCSLTATVTSATAGGYTVTLPANSITSSSGISNTVPASATLTVGP